MHWQEVHSGWAAAWEAAGQGTPPRPVGAAREAAVEFARDVAARASCGLYEAAKAIGAAALRLPPSKRVWGLAECDPYAAPPAVPDAPVRLVRAVPRDLASERKAVGREIIAAQDRGVPETAEEYLSLLRQRDELVRLLDEQELRIRRGGRS